jgi:hypothetical protein
VDHAKVLDVNPHGAERMQNDASAMQMIRNCFIVFALRDQLFGSYSDFDESRQELMET